jgi:signal peptidase I
MKMNDLGMEEKSRKKEPKKRSAVSYIIEFAIYIALILLCIFWVPEHVVQRTVVSGESMENTLHNGESLLVNKIAYEPSRYDIVVFYPLGREEDEYYVKRIYGLPGETVQIKGKDIYINNQIIEDKYAKNAMDDAGIAEEPLKLGEDEYFVLGDNRRVSKDSRDSEVGPVKKENIAGHVVFRIWPLSKFGTP